MQPSEFWRLPVCDWWAELDAHIIEARRLQEKMGGAKSGGSAFSQAQWDEARRKHREKMGKR